MSRSKIMKAIDHRLEILDKRLKACVDDNEQYIAWMATMDRQDELISLRDYIEEHIPDHSKTTVKVWRFADAPEKYKQHVSDAKWIAFVPEGLDEWSFINWTITIQIEGGKIVAG